MRRKGNGSGEGVHGLVVLVPPPLDRVGLNMKIGIIGSEKLH
jgi:hypothetical protein